MDLKAEAEKQHHLKSLQQRTSGEVAKPLSPGLRGFQVQLPCWHSVPQPTEGLCLGRINPHCERE